MAAGRIERQEFGYRRHGTVNRLVGLTPYNGRMWVNVWTKTMTPTFGVAVRWLPPPYSWAKRIHLIMDNGPSHTSDDTRDFFQQPQAARPRHGRAACCLVAQSSRNLAASLHQTLPLMVGVGIARWP